VAFTIKNIALIILFACLVGWLHSSHVEIKNKIKMTFKTAWVNALALA